MFCTKCGSESVKSGFVKGEQRYRCKKCRRQFVPTRQHGKTQTQKLTATLLYINGLSLRTIARLLQVTAPAILKWVKQYSLETCQKPKPQNNPAEIELDEMWHYLGSKKTSFGFGVHIVALHTSSLTRNVEATIVELFCECLTDYVNGM